MKSIKGWIGIFAIACGIALFIFVLMHENTLTMHPKGIMARKELHLIGTLYGLMFLIVIPTLGFFYIAAWKHRSKNAEYDPEHSYGKIGEWMLWLIPSSVIAVMIVINWYATHELDPYRPLKSEFKPVEIQVVALDWKWLFIYPEEGIATINFIQFPFDRPIHFSLAADGSPMNSFWIPSLSGQIYAMTGMITPLHIMADGPGEYRGRAAEINGEGYADMTFVAKSTSVSEYEKWVESVKITPITLSYDKYSELLKPSQKHPVTLYSSVEKDLFHKIVMKYMLH